MVMIDGVLIVKCCASVRIVVIVVVRPPWYSVLDWWACCECGVVDSLKFWVFHRLTLVGFWRFWVRDLRPWVVSLLL